MKVLFLSHYPYLYGANRSLLNLVKELRLYNVEPYIIAPAQGDFTEELDKNNIPYSIFDLELDFIDRKKFNGIAGKFARVQLWFRNYKNAAKIALFIKHLNFDLIYSNSSVINTGFYLAKRLKLPHVWHIREFGNLDYNLAPVLGYKHFNALLSRSTAVVFVSQCLKDHYHASRLNSYIVYNGVVPEDFFLKYKKRTSKDKNPQRSNFIFCIVSLVGFQKNQMDAIRAFELLQEKYDKITLVVAGGGDRTSLEAYVANRNIHSVEFLGHVKNPFSVYLSSDVSLMCSKYEAMGRVTIEAMSVKTPVIGRNSYGTKELIQHNETGLLYDGTINDLAAQMERLMLDMDLRERIANNGWTWAFENCTQEIYGKKIYNIISTLAEKIQY